MAEVQHARTSAHVTAIKPLAAQFPTVDSAVAEIARLSAQLVLPAGTVHVISDIHGEDQKLRHIINNASGTLRPLVQELFANELSAKEFQEFLTLIFYPAEVVARLEKTLTDPAALRTYAQQTIGKLFRIVRHLAARYSLRDGLQVFPPEYRDLLSEILYEPTADRGGDYLTAMTDELVRRGRALHLIHLTCRVVRNLAVSHLIIAGDLWDRGPRGDRVVEYLKLQPRVSFVWGNHDMAWLGASLGCEALACHVLRVSLRYRRLTQIDEGYSIPLTPLEYLARTVYADDPAKNFFPKESGLRDKVIVARMQKAAAIMQFKLEGQIIARHPEWGMENRRLLHRIDPKAGTIEVDGVTYALRDNYFPTLDSRDAYALSAEEQKCLTRLMGSFKDSEKLRCHMEYIVRNGSMYSVSDDHLIFHGCVPTDKDGTPLPMVIDGEARSGRAMYEAIERVVHRALERSEQNDTDLLWYLWSGPRSPLFGKDRIATFERDFIADAKSHHETRDPYFSLIHEAPFCEKILREFGVDPQRGLIVNGHVPVKIEKGENPLKRSGKAITIDGAFSEAYGDHGYTLVLENNRTFLAKHHHFESVEAAIKDGVDIIPSVTEIRKWDPPRRVADSQRGQEIRWQIEMLEKLIDAYRGNRLQQRC
jgi:fructose-1,6-bisphosphatase III